jgi:hypothetical protein
MPLVIAFECWFWMLLGYGKHSCREFEELIKFSANLYLLASLTRTVFSVNLRQILYMLLA